MRVIASGLLTFAVENPPRKLLSAAAYAMPLATKSLPPASGRPREPRAVIWKPDKSTVRSRLLASIV